MVTETNFRLCNVKVQPPASVLLLPLLRKGSREERQVNMCECDRKQVS